MPERCTCTNPTISARRRREGWEQYVELWDPLLMDLKRLEVLRGLRMWSFTPHFPPKSGHIIRNMQVT